VKESDKGLENLKVWVSAKDLAVEVCKSVIPRLPVQERYALTNQLRRAVQSIPANIAEAYGRYGFQDAIRFCYIARGSLEETRSHLYIASELGYLQDAVFEQLLKDVNKIGKLLNGYIHYLKINRKGIIDHS
jgi:four helix bundle protein